MRPNQSRIENRVRRQKVFDVQEVTWGISGYFIVESTVIAKFKFKFKFNSQLATHDSLQTTGYTWWRHERNILLTQALGELYVSSWSKENLSWTCISLYWACGTCSAVDWSLVRFWAILKMVRLYCSIYTGPAYYQGKFKAIKLSKIGHVVGEEEVYYTDVVPICMCSTTWKTPERAFFPRAGRAFRTANQPQTAVV